MVIKQRVLIVGATGYLGKFIVKELKSLEIVKAKERFAQELKEAGIEYIIIRPNGFFSEINMLGQVKLDFYITYSTIRNYIRLSYKI
jgi:uncharacterized protein YbjT (DUF2867 family)